MAGDRTTIDSGVGWGRQMALGESMGRRGGLAHRSVLALIACVIGLATSVVPIFAIGSAVLLTSISKESGWTRGAVSSLIAAGLIGIAIGAPVVGRLIDSYGARRIVVNGRPENKQVLILTGCVTSKFLI